MSLLQYPRFQDVIGIVALFGCFFKEQDAARVPEDSTGDQLVSEQIAEIITEFGAEYGVLQTEGHGCRQPARKAARIV